MKKRILKIAVGSLLILTFLLPPGALLERHHRAEAFSFGPFVINIDLAQFLKEFIKDVLVPQLKARVISRIVGGVINWANTGFEGSPSFALNMRDMDRGIGIAAGSALLSQIQASSSLCTSYKDLIARSLRYDIAYDNSRDPLRAYRKASQCTLGGALNTFYNDWGRGGGFDTWTGTMFNHPYYQYMLARSEYDRLAQEQKDRKHEEVNRNQGFLNFNRCYDTATGKVVKEFDPSKGLEGLNTGFIECRTETPGSVISAQVNKVLPAPLDNIIEADEMDELIRAVINGLLNKVMGSTGLLGLSSGGSGLGGGSYTDDLIEDEPPIGDNVGGYLISLVDMAIDNEQSFKTAQMGVVAALEDLEGVLSDLKSCYETHNNATGAAAADARFETARQLRLAAEAELAQSDIILTRLRDLKTRLQTMTSAEGLDQAYDDYQRITSEAHDGGDAQAAASAVELYERQKDSAESELSRCRLGL